MAAVGGLMRRSGWRGCGCPALLVSRRVRLGVGGVTVGGCCSARLSARASGRWRADGGVEAWPSVSPRDVVEWVGGVAAQLVVTW
jgi:hypothetical protein